MTDSADYTSRQRNAERFIELAKENTNLDATITEPLIQTFASMCAMISISHDIKLRTAENNLHLTTATDNSAILAKSGDLSYTPRKALPSIGVSKVTDQPLSGLPSGISLLSDAGVNYRTMDSVTLDENGIGYVELAQLATEEITHTVTETKPYYEITLDQKYSSRLHKIEVYANVGRGLEPWTYMRRLRGARNTDLAYDEFYTAANEYGIRFGTGTVGMIPLLGTQVRITVWLTDGSTTLVQGAKLKSTDPSYANVEFEVLEAVIGGEAQEDQESIRKNSLYYELHDDQYVWNDDYSLKIESALPGITWLNIWGEQHQETIAGGFSLDHVNKIYVSAYHPLMSYEDLAEAMLSALSEIPQLNRKYEAVQPNELQFAVSISGVVSRNYKLSDARLMIMNSLLSVYGKSATDRRHQCLKKDVYADMKALGVFNGEFDIDIDITGQSSAENKSQFLYLAATDAALSLVYG